MVEDLRNTEPIPFDIILISHGRMELTIESVKALYALTKTPFNLVVVDDSTPDLDEGTDLTPQWFERFKKKHDNLTFIHSEIPYREGNQIFNIGLKHCKHEFVAVVMNSIIVEPEWERVALQFMKENPRILDADGKVKEGGVGIVGLKQLNTWDRIESAGIIIDKDDIFGQGCRPIDLQRDHPSHRFTTLYEVEAVPWALAILRKEAVVGSLEEGIFNGFRGVDDIDNCFVVRSKGWKVFYCGYGCGIHKTRATRGSNTEVDIELNRRNQEAFYKRWDFWERYLATTPIANRAKGGNGHKKVLSPNKLNRAERRRLQKVNQ